ncbi:MAG: tetratricopeptide repeat protein [Planctomycetota bacterium]|jgi:tetratricopeptide (TPR) repeat protein
MEKRKDINILDFSTIFQALGVNQRTGTLRVTSGRKDRRIYIKHGLVAGVFSPEKVLRIGEALLKSGKIVEKQLKKALAKQGKSKKNLGRICIQLKFISDADLIEALAFQVTEEICDVFTWDSVHCEFTEGAAPPGIEKLGSTSGPSLPVEMLVMEAARRNDEWGLLSQAISLKDVYLMTPAAASYFREKGTEGEREILHLMDGRRDVEEIAEAAHRGKFEAIKIMHGLATRKEIAPITGKDLLKLGHEEAEKENWSKAIRLYERALEHGVKEFDLSYRLAKMHEAQGSVEDAAKMYLTFARQCESAGDLKKAVEAYRAVLGLESDRFDLHERLIEMLMRLRRTDDVISEAARLAEKWVARARHEEAINLWRRIVDYAPQDTLAIRQLADLYRGADDNVQAIIELENLAAILLSDGKPRDAIGVYREMLRLDDECVQARLGLAETLARTGSSEDAVREYNALAENLSASGVIKDSTNWEFLINIYEKIVALRPDNLLARRWLAAAYQEKSDPKKALLHLRGIVDALLERESYSEAVAPLRKVVELAPDDVENRLRLAELYLRERDTERALVEYHRLARHAVSRRDMSLAKRALGRALEVNPFYLTAHREFAEIAAKENDKAVQIEHLATIGRMAGEAGQYPEARAAYADILHVDPANLNALNELAEIHIKRGNIREAVDLLVHFAEIHLESQNLGLASDTAKRVLALVPGHVRARDLLSEARRRSGYIARSVTGAGATTSDLASPSISYPKSQTPQPTMSKPGEDPAGQPRTKSGVLDSIKKLQGMKVETGNAGHDEGVSKSKLNLGKISDAVRSTAASAGAEMPEKQPEPEPAEEPAAPDTGGEQEDAAAADPLAALEAMGDIPSWKDAEGGEEGPKIEMPGENQNGE